MSPYRTAPNPKSEKIVIDQVGEPEIEISGDRLVIKRTYQLKAHVELVEIEPRPEPMFSHFKPKRYSILDTLCHPVVVLCAATITTAWALFR